jgi:hypothetical protein
LTLYHLHHTINQFCLIFCVVTQNKMRDVPVWCINQRSYGLCSLHIVRMKYMTSDQYMWGYFDTNGKISRWINQENHLCGLLYFCIRPWMIIDYYFLAHRTCMHWHTNFLFCGYFVWYINLFLSLYNEGTILKQTFNLRILRTYKSIID